jgi:hypothetical protein
MNINLAKAAMLILFPAHFSRPPAGAGLAKAFTPKQFPARIVHSSMQ